MAEETDLFVGADDKKPKDNNNEAEVVKNEDGSFVVNGKVFKDVDALINSKVHADNHINTLMSEKQKQAERLAQIEADKQELGSLKSQVERLLDAQNLTDSEQVLFEGTQNMADKQETSQSLPQEAIAKVVEEAVGKAVKPFQDQVAQQKAEESKRKVREALIDKYGSKDAASKVYSEFRETSGLSGELLEQMINTNPDALAKLVIASKPVGSTPQERTRQSGHGADVGIPTGHRGGDTPPAVPQGAGYKELLNKMKTTPGLFTLADQEAMNAGYDKFGEGYFNT